MKNNKTMIFVGVALALGLVGAYFAAMLGAKPATDMIEVPVANTNLRTMTKLADPAKMFVPKSIPRDMVNTDGGANSVVLKMEELKDQFLIKPKTAGSFIVRSDLSRTGTVEFEKGMTGYALKVDAESMAGGLIGPGTRVNVNWTGRVEGNKPPLSGFLMTDVTVVAVDAKTARGDQNEEFKNPGVVTLQIKPADVTMLARAKSLGGFSLSLCNPEAEGEKDAPRAQVDAQLVKFLNSKSTAKDEEVKQVVKTIFVAKDEIPANTKIDGESFDKFFESKTLPDVLTPQDAIENRDEIVDRYTTTKLARGFHVVPTLLSKDPLEEKKPGVVGPPPEDHAVVIVNGGQRPFVAVYRRGVLANGDELKDPPSKTVPTEKAPAPKEKEDGTN